ncbi:MAG: hypothetical protein GY756_05140, partial [bacterium]|nr:hypothetical protein [bacterium]
NIIDDYYSFSHDRVQEAAYSLIPDKEKIKHHYYIGNLAQRNSEKNISDNIFYIVNQLNAGENLVTDKSEKQNLSKLNLLAGKKALASNAYMSALKYLTLGIDLLNENSWKENYSFTLELYQEATIAAQQSADYGAMEKLAEKVFQNARTILDKIRVYEIQIYACQARNQLIEG